MSEIDYFTKFFFLNKAPLHRVVSPLYLQKHLTLQELWSEELSYLDVSELKWSSSNSKVSLLITAKRQTKFQDDQQNSHLEKSD